jgi:hypothetical protein
LLTTPVTVPSISKPTALTASRLVQLPSTSHVPPISSQSVPAPPLPITPARTPSASRQGSKSARAPPDPEKVQAALALLVQVGYPGVTEDDLGKLNPPDEYETELLVMAQVRGYFQVAYKVAARSFSKYGSLTNLGLQRVIDNVPAAIDLRFVRAVASELLPFLMKKFELGTANGAARCGMYLAEDPNLVAKRDELTARKKRLESVSAELHNFGL